MTFCFFLCRAADELARNGPAESRGGSKTEHNVMAGNSSQADYEEAVRRRKDQDFVLFVFVWTLDIT